MFSALDWAVAAPCAPYHPWRCRVGGLGFRESVALWAVGSRGSSGVEVGSWSGVASTASTTTGLGGIV